jgi:hypothetical protein
LSEAVGLFAQGQTALWHGRVDMLCITMQE